MFSKFHMRGTLLKNPQKVERFLNRTVRTVASAQSEVFQAGERLFFLFFVFFYVEMLMYNYPANSGLV